MVDDPSKGPYARSALDWFDAGWSPLPLPPAAKWPPPEGYTGIDAPDPKRAKVREWIKALGEGNIAIRLPDNVIGIDVDAYGDKHGDETLAELEAQDGELPPTNRSSARGPDNPSGIRWFRIREGERFPGVLGPGIEVIQRHHRYAIVWPSVNPKTQTVYTIYDDRTGETIGVFTADDLEPLPERWYEVTALRGEGLDKSLDLTPDEVAEWFRDEANSASYCRAMRNVLNRELERLETASDSGESRYDTARDGVMALVRLAQEGHRGVKKSVAKLRGLYEEVVADEPDRDPTEWRRMVIGAVAAVADHMEDAHEPGRCPDREIAEVDDTLWPSPNEPYDVAERLVREIWTTEGGTTLRFWRGDFYEHAGTHWRPVDTDGLRSRLYKVLANVGYMSAAKQPTELRWNPNRTKVGHVLEALEAVTHYGADADDADGAINFTNGYLDFATRTLKPHTPDRFNLTCLPFAYETEAEQPKAWFGFLDSIELDEDEELLLQEWFGYVVSGETSKHKMLLLIGPPRAGKGVITRTLQRLVGVYNCASPTLDQLATNFGLQGAVGKSLITINDARFGGRSAKPVIERLLNISGQDEQIIDRKNREPWQGVLPGRVMIVSNELPNLSGEASSALSSRFVGPIELSNEFLGREDETLESRIAAELPGVLSWALDGYERLREQGHFTRPQRSQLVARELAESMSPMLAFVNSCCELTAGPVSAGNVFTPTNELYRAYQRWSDHEGRGFVLDRARFARELRVATKQRIVQSSKRDGEKRIQGYRGIRLVPGIWETVAGMDF